MRFKLALVAAVMIFSAASVHADEQSRLQEARELVELSHAVDHAREVLAIFSKRMRPILLQQSGSNTKLVDQLMAKMEQRSAQNIGGFVDLAAQLYAREFSDDDLNAMVSFYESPAGQHLVAKQVVIASGMMALGQKWGEQVAQDVLKEFKQDQGTGAPKL